MSDSLAKDVKRDISFHMSCDSVNEVIPSYFFIGSASSSQSVRSALNSQFDIPECSQDSSIFIEDHFVIESDGGSFEFVCTCGIDSKVGNRMLKTWMTGASGIVFVLSKCIPFYLQADWLQEAILMKPDGCLNVVVLSENDNTDDIIDLKSSLQSLFTGSINGTWSIQKTVKESIETLISYHVESSTKTEYFGDPKQHPLDVKKSRSDTIDTCVTLPDSYASKNTERFIH